MALSPEMQVSLGISRVVPERGRQQLLVAVAMILCGCSSTYIVRSTTPDDMNDLFRDRDITIALRSGEEVHANRAVAIDDSLSWVELGSSKECGVNMGQISKITIVKTNAGLGALEGLVIGAVGGFGVGWLVGSSSAGGNRADAAISGFAAGLLYGAPIGAGIGLIVGSAIGHGNYFEFQLAEGATAVRRPRTEQNSLGAAILHLRNGTIEASLNDYDTIHLRNGTMIRGTIVGEVGDGEHLVRVTIRKWDDTILTFGADEIERIQRQIR